MQYQQNQTNNNNNPSLPPVRKNRPSSSTSDYGSWNKVLTSQRKMSLELPQQELTKTKPLNRSRSTEKEKVCPRLSRTFRGDTSLEANRVREKVEPQSELIKILRFNDPLVGDDPLILEGSMILEKIDQSIGSEKFSPKSWILLAESKLKLQRLLLEKVKIITEEDCLNLIQDGLAYIRQLESIYTEDRYKLETARAFASLPEKERKMALDDFMGTVKKRKGLPSETEKRFSSWIASLSNSQRLLNVNYRLPKERLTVLMVQRAAAKLESSKIAILHWLSLTLTTNVKTMALYWDHLPFETLCDLFSACLTFNSTFPSQAIDPIKILASTQAESSSLRISFLVQSEAKKIASAKRRSDQTTKPVNTSGSTSDYFTASSISENGVDSKLNNSQSISAQGETIDLSSYLSIVLASSQRVVLKLSFLLHNALNSPSTPSQPATAIVPDRQSRATGRSTWSKVDLSVVNASKMSSVVSQTSDVSLYWPVFWQTFTRKLLSDILFPSNGSIMASSPIFCSPKAYQSLVGESIALCLRTSDLPSEAVVEFKEMALELTYHLTDQHWTQNYLTIYRMINDRSNCVFGRNDDLTYSHDSVEIILKLFSVHSNDYNSESSQIYRQCSVIQSDSLLRLISNHLSSLSDRKPLKDLVIFFKDIQPLDKAINLINSNQNAMSNITLIFKNIIDSLDMKINSNLYNMTVRAFAHRISQQRAKITSNQPDPIIPYVKQLILDPNLELLADCQRTNHVSQLKRNMITSFGKVVNQIATNSTFEGKIIRTNRAIRSLIKSEIIDFIGTLDSNWTKIGQLNEIDELKKLIEEGSSQSKDNCSFFFKRFNRIYPITRDLWSEEQTFNQDNSDHNNLSRCGCFF